MKQLGPEHVNVACSYDNLGIVWKDLGDFQQAQDSYACALDIYVKQLTHEHVHVATSCNNLGIVYRNLVYFQQARDSHAHALNIRLKQLGPEHVDVATSYNNLGILSDFHACVRSYVRILRLINNKFR